MALGSAICVHQELRVLPLPGAMAQRSSLNASSHQPPATTYSSALLRNAATSSGL